MKIKHIVLASTILVSVSSFAQKDELKALKKIYAKDEIKGNDLAEYKALVTKVQPLATEEGDKVYAGFYKAMTPVLESMAIDQTMTPVQIQAALIKLANPKAVSDLAEGLNTTLDYEKKTGKKIYTDDINEKIAVIKPQLLNVAIGLGDAKMYKESATVLHAIYLLDKNEKQNLYYAANYALNGKDYDTALGYYNQLKAMNYTGEGTLYWAKNKATGQEENFPTKEQRELFIKTGTHEKPRDEKLPSKRGEVYKSIALILVEQGKTEEAKTAMTDARKANPSDDTLVLAELNLYLELKDYTAYTKLVNEALVNNPNNIDLVYNLGVISAESGKLDEAEKYYKRALEINPNYFNANLNLAELLLRGDDKFVTEMNKLGTSEKDNKRYEVLKAERNKNFKTILPYLEKAYELEPNNDAAKKTLLSVYNALEMTDKYKALKAKM
jgi:tetratricopeptide (TPR) repeat protein